MLNKLSQFYRHDLPILPMSNPNSSPGVLSFQLEESKTHPWTQSNQSSDPSETTSFLFRTTKSLFLGPNSDSPYELPEIIPENSVLSLSLQSYVVRFLEAQYSQHAEKLAPLCPWQIQGGVLTKYFHCPPISWLEFPASSGAVEKEPWVLLAPSGPCSGIIPIASIAHFSP